ncbi:MAG: glycosyltransferase family 2 protein [Eubacterium sp.]|nr:glycosyltransferase family 2 protein [Eubacterium sp.]
MNDLVSIIIPCYNVEKYLDRCLNSVVNQTYQNLEIILIDDGSTDNTPVLCDEWTVKDKRIKVIHKANDGLANARNTGIEVCTGDYVMFTDSDDYVEPDTVEFLLSLSLKYNADVSRCGFYYDYDDGRVEAVNNNDEILLLNSDERMIDLIAGAYMSGVAWNKLYSRDIIKKHPYSKEDGCSEDLMHNFRVYQDIHTSVFCNQPKYHYVENGASITHSEFGYGAFDIIRARSIMLEHFKNDEGIYPHALEWYIKTSLVVLTGCVINNACRDQYETLKHELRQYKLYVFKCGQFKKKYRIKYLMFCYLPYAFNRLIRRFV